MKSSRYSCWRASLLFCLGLLIHCGEAQVFTEVQAGPLYRVVGSRLSISCNVSGFTNENAQKEFQFSIRKPARPSTEINIISTNDELFSYAMYSRRVMSRGITVERVSPNSVRFELQMLQKDDEGEYHCTVINSERAYFGTYNANITVKVIDNSLSVSSSDSSPQTYNEGDPLTLTCKASSNTFQHTHLSFAWYLHRDGEDTAQPIISLDREFTLSSGQGFEERYQAGLIRLDKIEEATYVLKMSQLQLSDRGKIYCEAHEWIQDPDRSWYSITNKNAEKLTLNIKAKEVILDTSALVVRISAKQTVLNEGQELSLSCSIDTQNLEEKFFSVAWLRGSVELARIGPTGILTVGPEYRVREKEGELRAARNGDRDYRIILHPVRTDDHGEYICRAWPQDRGQDGAFIQGAAQDSTSQLINISATESGLSVQMHKNTEVNESDSLTLTCKVDGVNGQLYVTWQYKSTPSVQFNSVITLNQDGVMMKAEKFKSRIVRATRPATDIFTLELDEVKLSDSGLYQCTVFERKTDGKSNSQSQTATVTVASADSLVKVSLISRNNRVIVGETVRLLCRISGPRMPIAVTWSRYTTTLDNILTVYSDGTISWSGDQQSYQVEVVNQANQIFHYLIINSASHREAATYQCSVSVFLQNVHKKLPQSNRLAVNVDNPETKLQLTSTANLTTSISTDIEISCTVTTKTSQLSRYAVTWLFQHEEEKNAIVSLDQDALVSFGPQVEQKLRERISTRHTEGPNFELTIRQAELSDKGSYICEVVEWLQDPHGEWFHLSPVSKTIEVTVTEHKRNLSIGTNKLELNVSSEFTLPCYIKQQSSSDSEFQVTWFWQEDKESQQQPIFTSYRNSTLHSRFRKLENHHLRFERPLPNNFRLTVLKPSPENSGLYSCEVEEWIPSLSGRWRKFAVETSQYVTVNVRADGTAEAQCMSNTWTGILGLFLICALLVILVLVLKLCCCKASGGNKGQMSGHSLWAEQHPLSTKPCAED